MKASKPYDFFALKPPREAFLLKFTRNIIAIMFIQNQSLFFFKKS